MKDEAAIEIFRTMKSLLGGPLSSEADAINFIEKALHEVRLKEQNRCCSLIYGHCNSDNVAARTVRAIRRGDT